MRINLTRINFFVGLIIYTSIAIAATNDWKVHTVFKIGSKQEQVWMDPNLIQICIYRDKTTSSFFSNGNWKATFGHAPSDICEDRLTADLINQILYLSIPNFLRQGGYLVGRADAYCPSNITRSEYSACTSNFFVKSSESVNYRNFNLNALYLIGEEAGLFVNLDKMRATKLAEIERRKHDIYLQEFKDATTINSIEQFENRYANEDPDGLIKYLAQRKETLQRDQQRKRYESAKSAKDYSDFIATYGTNDLEGLVPSAIIKKSESEKREAIESEVLKKQSQLSELEGQILHCLNITNQAKTSIERENKIGQVSGYVNKKVLREAGEVIVMCQENIPKIYAEYRKKGGLKTLSSIRK